MTHKLCVLVHAEVGILLLATTIEDKHIARVLPTHMLVKYWQTKLKPCPRHYKGDPIPIPILGSAEDRFPGYFLELLDQSSMGNKDTFACM